MSQTADILLVEDSEADAELTLRTLRRAAGPPRLDRGASRGLGMQVEHVRDGAQALAYLFCTGVYALHQNGAGQASQQPGTPMPAGHEQPRLVMLDLKMPRVDGLEVLAQIKQDPRTRHIPVVVMTSSREERDIARCYALGANSYVQKPVEYQEFSKVVAEVGSYWMQVNQSPGASACPAP